LIGLGTSRQALGLSTFSFVGEIWKNHITIITNLKNRKFPVWIPIPIAGICQAVFIDIRFYLDTYLLNGFLGDTCPATTVGEAVSIESSNIVMRHGEID